MRPPTRHPFVDLRTGIISPEWLKYLDSLSTETAAASDASTEGDLDATRLVGLVPLASLANLTNAQISALAAIAWSKISKTGSSLSDLESRLATALIISTSDVAIGRLSAGSGPAEEIAARFIRTGTGHPQGVLAAPVGTRYVDTNTGYEFRKRGGGTTAYGWYYVPELGSGYGGRGPIWFARQAAYEQTAYGAFGFDPGMTVSGGSTARAYVSGSGLWQSITTGAVSGNSSALLSVSNQIRYWEDDFDFSGTLYLPSVSALRLFFGIASFSVSGTDTPTNPGTAGSMLFRFSTNVPDSGWVGWTSAGASGAATASAGAIAATTVYRVRLRFIRSGTPTLHFSVNDGTEISTTSNIPVTGVAAYLTLHLTTLEAVAKSAYWRVMEGTIGAQS